MRKPTWDLSVKQTIAAFVSVSSSQSSPRRESTSRASVYWNGIRLACTPRATYLRSTSSSTAETGLPELRPSQGSLPAARSSIMSLSADALMGTSSSALRMRYLPSHA